MSGRLHVGSFQSKFSFSVIPTSINIQPIKSFGEAVYL